MITMQYKIIKLIGTKYFLIEMRHLENGQYCVYYETSNGNHEMPELAEYELASAMFDLKYEHLDAIYSDSVGVSNLQ